MKIGKVLMDHKLYHQTEWVETSEEDVKKDPSIVKTAEQSSPRLASLGSKAPSQVAPWAKTLKLYGGVKIK